MPIGTFLVAMLVCATGCRHQPAAGTSKPVASSWAGFGEAGPDKIAVVVSGDVQHPGKYYLAAGASLDSLYAAFGGWGGHGELGAPPHRVLLTRENAGKRTETYYEIKKMTPREKQAVILKDGDSIYYPVVLF
jgi:hypothetical protein